MGEITKIEWTATRMPDGRVIPGATFNPWWGCVKVSPACEHCYAETMAKRFGHAVWGPASTTQRRFFKQKHWDEPFKWNAECEAEGIQRKVFCASMADVFEDNDALTESRELLLELIEATPRLVWLLLTKRPENILPMTERWMAGADADWPRNVWVGTTVETQEYAEKRIPHLLKAPAPVRFLSCEPLLGQVRLSKWLDNISGLPPMGDWDGAPTTPTGWYQIADWEPGIEWVITGGESGPGKRFCDPDWMRSLRDQCQAAGVPFFMKQMDKVQPIPDDLLVREMPEMSSVVGAS